VTTIYWITKFALTNGVMSLSGCDEPENGYLSKSGPWDGAWDERRHFYGPSEWHLTRDAALAKAEDMRTKRIASLKKQIAKLEKLSFAP